MDVRGLPPHERLTHFQLNATLLDIPALVRILIQPVFSPQTPLTSWTLCLTMRPPSQGHPPSQRSPMLPRAVSHCHGNRGQRRAPQCPRMSSRLSGTSVTYCHEQRLVTPNFHGNNRCGSLCGEVKQVRIVSGRNFLDLLSLKTGKHCLAFTFE